MTTNVRFYPAHLRADHNMAAIATDGYTVTGYSLLNLRKVYRAMRRSTGNATMARIAVLGVMHAGRASELDTTCIDRKVAGMVAADTLEAVAA